MIVNGLSALNACKNTGNSLTDKTPIDMLLADNKKNIPPMCECHKRDAVKNKGIYPLYSQFHI